MQIIMIDAQLEIVAKIMLFICKTDRLYIKNI